MYRPHHLALGTALAAGALVATAPSALAACDAYSNGCTDIEVLPTVQQQAPSDTAVTPQVVSPRAVTPQRVDTPSSLPFTGGEVVLVAVIGAGALAGGAALVVAGRRRTHAA